MDFLTQLSPIDLFIVGALAAGVFAGFTQGMIRYALNAMVVMVAFVIASQLHAPIAQAFGFWNAFTPALRDQVLFLVTFVGLVVAGWFLVKVLYHRTSLPIIRQLDELGGAVLGLLFAALSMVFTLLVMDSFFRVAPDAETAGAGFLHGIYTAMDSSVLIEFFRTVLIPTFGALAKPFVPPDIASLLEL